MSRPRSEELGRRAPPGLEISPPECHALFENGEEDEKASADSYQCLIRVKRYVIHTKQPFLHTTLSSAVGRSNNSVPANSLLTLRGSRNNLTRGRLTPVSARDNTRLIRACSGQTHDFSSATNTPAGVVAARDFDGEFDPGSGRTLAARLTHASRTLSTFGSYGRVANG